MKSVAFMRMVLLLYHPAERLRQYHVVQRVGLGEQRGYLRVPEARYATAYARDKEKLVGIAAGILYKIINIRPYGFHAALHGWYGVTLPLDSYAITPFRPKFIECHSCSAASMKASQITAKHKDFIVAQRTYIRWCKQRFTLSYFIFCHHSYALV